MKKLFVFSLFVFGVLLVSVKPLAAQEKYVLGEEQELIVFGTSTLHNWEMVTTTAEGSGLFWLDQGVLDKVSDLKVSFAAESLDSGRGGIMDRNARRALKWEEHPMVSFELEEFGKGEDGNYEASGQMTAAGVSKPVTFNITYTAMTEKLEVQGTTSFKLTDFDIKPPVALAGTLRTSDAVSVEFTLLFEKTSHQ